MESIFVTSLLICTKKIQLCDLSWQILMQNVQVRLVNIFYFFFAWKLLGK